MPQISSRRLLCRFDDALLFMFKPVNRRLSLVAALFSLAGCVVMTLGLFPRLLTHQPPIVFRALLPVDGYLIFTSTFLPRILGALMALAGVGWLAFLVSQPRTLSDSRHRGPRHPRGSIVDAVAHRDGRKRSTMERAGRRGMKAAVYCSGAATPPSLTTQMRMRWGANNSRKEE